MQAGPRLRRHVVAAGHDLRCPWVGAACLGLLVVGQRQHPEGEDLVDLGGVAQVTGALRGDLRMVVEDDRRGQHEIIRRADEHREGAVVGASGDGLGGRRRWVEQGDEPAVVDGQHDVHGDERPAHHLVARRLGRAPVGDVLHGDGDGEEGAGSRGPRRLDAHPTGDGPALPHGAADDVATTGAQFLDVDAARQVDRHVDVSRRDGQQRQFADGDVVFDRFVPRHPLGAVDVEHVDRLEASAGRAPRSCGGPVAGSADARGASARRRDRRRTSCPSTSARSRRARPAAAGRAPRTASGPGSCAPKRGTGTARSPRRARRRRRRAPRRSGR